METEHTEHTNIVRIYSGKLTNSSSCGKLLANILLGKLQRYTKAIIENVIECLADNKHIQLNGDTNNTTAYYSRQFEIQSTQHTHTHTHPQCKIAPPLYLGVGEASVTNIALLQRNNPPVVIAFILLLISV